MLGRIEARSKEKLALKIIPKQSKPFELAVRWDFKQAPSQAMIEVQEPKLTMRLDGPREVLFGKREVYKLKLGNSGNGAAENVLLTLMPLNAGDTHPITHRLGTINAGDERSIEIELTARQAGNLTIRVEANGDGGAHVDLAEHVLVHRAALQIDAEGPAVQYVGTPANYKIHVRNPGDAPAKNVKLTVKLPTGVKFISGSDGATSETAVDGGKVRWTLEQLPPGEQRVLEMKCTLALSGANRLEITSSRRRRPRGRGRGDHAGRGHGRSPPGGEGPGRPRAGRLRRELRTSRSQPRHQGRRERGSAGLFLQRRGTDQRRRPDASHQPGAGRFRSDSGDSPGGRTRPEGEGQGGSGRQPRVPCRSALQGDGDAAGPRRGDPLLPGRSELATSHGRAGKAGAGRSR